MTALAVRRALYRLPRAGRRRRRRLHLQLRHRRSPSSLRCLHRRRSRTGHPSHHGVRHLRFPGRCPARQNDPRGRPRTKERLMRKTLVVAGHGMVGQWLVEIAVERSLGAEWDIVVHAEEDVHAYDRVGLSSWFSGRTADELCLVAEGFYEAPVWSCASLTRSSPSTPRRAPSPSPRAGPRRTTRLCSPPARRRSSRRCRERPGRDGSCTALSPTSPRSVITQAVQPAAPSSAEGCSALRPPMPCCRWASTPAWWSSPRG